MNTNHTREARHKGFTLLELLLVMAMIGILAAIVIVAINPGRQLGLSRDVRRESDLVNIQKALELYKVDNNLYPLQNEIPVGRYEEICLEGESVDCFDLSLLVPLYIASIPVDPMGGGYQIGINQDNGRISIYAESAEIREVVINKIPPDNTYVMRVTGTTDPSTDLVTYSDGTKILLGNFSGTRQFGEGDNIVSLTSAGSWDVYMIKYNREGEIEWAKRHGGSGAEYPAAIANVSDQGSMVAGRFTGTSTFGEGLSAQTIVSEGLNDAFISKHDSGGNLVWLEHIRGSNQIFANDIEAYFDGSAIVGGVFSGTAIFGKGVNAISLTSGSTRDVFIAKYDSNGELEFVKQAGGSTATMSAYIGVTSHSDGSSTVTGGFGGITAGVAGIAIFGEGINAQSVTQRGVEWDMFVAHYNEFGDLQWVKNAGGNSQMGATGIDSLSDGSSVVVGEYQTNHGNPTWAIGEPNQTTLTGAGWRDIFIVKYNNDGTLAWAISAGDWGNDSGKKIATDIDDNIFIVGYVEHSPTFARQEETQFILNGSGARTFLAKYDSDGIFGWVINVVPFANWGKIMMIDTYQTGSVSISTSFSNPGTFPTLDGAPIIKSPAGIYTAKYNSEGYLLPLE